MIRRFGEAVQPQRYVMRPGAYAILALGDSVLLTHQQDPEPEIQLPGGGIDPGESAISALHREVMEETGWRIANPRRLGAFRRFTYMPEYNLWAEKVCQIFLARPVVRHGPPGEFGHTELWAPITVAPELLVDEGARFFLKRAVL